MKPLALLALLAIASGCATTTQELASAPETRVVLELRGNTPSGPVVIVGTAQIGLTARPVGIEAINPALSAAPNVNSPNSTAASGHASHGQAPVPAPSTPPTPSTESTP